MEDEKLWEKRSAKIILGLRKGILIYCILVMVLLFLYNVGFQKDIEQTLDAFVITEEGESFPCEIYMTGKVTEYPLKNLVRRRRGYAYSGEITVQISGKRIGILNFDLSGIDHARGSDHISVFLLRRDRSVFLAHTDAQEFFPELDSQSCVIAAPAEKASEVLAYLQDSLLPEDFLETCQWILE